MIRIGIDLGGTKTELAAIDRDGRELLRRRVPTPSDSYEDSVGEVATLVSEAERELGRTARVGLGHPGAIEPASAVAPMPFTKRRLEMAAWLTCALLSEEHLARPAASAMSAVAAVQRTVRPEPEITSNGPPRVPAGSMRSENPGPEADAPGRVAGADYGSPVVSEQQACETWAPGNPRRHED